MVGLSPHTLYGWKKRFEEEGPAALTGTGGRRQGGGAQSPGDGAGVSGIRV